MSLPTQTILNAGTKVTVAKFKNKQREQYEFTLTETGVTPPATDDTTLTIQVTAASSDTIPAGGLTLGVNTVLDFGVEKVTITEDLVIAEGEEDTDVTLKVKALTTDWTGGETATTNGALMVLGGSSVSFQTSDNEVSTRSFENNLFDDARKTMLGATIPWQGHYVKGDKAIETIVQPAAYSDEEIWVQIEYPDGIKRSGACFIQGYTEEAGLDEIRRTNWTYRLVGEFVFDFAS